MLINLLKIEMMEFSKFLELFLCELLFFLQVFYIFFLFSLVDVVHSLEQFYPMMGLLKKFLSLIFPLF